MTNIRQIFQSRQPATVCAGEMYHQIADGAARVGVIREELFVGDLVDRVPDAASHVKVIFDKGFDEFKFHGLLLFHVQ